MWPMYSNFLHSLASTLLTYALPNYNNTKFTFLPSCDVMLQFHVLTSDAMLH